MAETEASVEGSEPKKGKLLLIVLPIIALLLIGGGGAGFAYFKKLGPFAKKVTAKAEEKPKSASKAPLVPPAAEPTAVVRTLPPTTKMDPEEGAAKLAKLWNEIEAPQLLAISKDWKDPELARVASKMDPAKVAEVLAAMPPKRASSLSREMQRLASVVSIDE